MTATPIPRTLNMSLVGIRDMSVIETPPRDRLAIQTQVVKFDTDVDRARDPHRARARRPGVLRPQPRRVDLLDGAISSRGSCPRRSSRSAHGQMSEDELERVMVDFVAHKYDVLVATTIVENGLDIPNANTIIINRADRYGLAQLYQLRGRVGRSDRRAYAYLLIPAEQTLSPIARRRLAAIREFSDLGSGFRIAALDLEIRGAGNLLGGEQSGHIEAVGFDMYMKLLEETIRELKGEDLEDERRAGRQPADRSAHRRDLHPGHEPAADGVPPAGERAHARRGRRRSSRSCAIVTARRPPRSRIWRNTRASGSSPIGSASKASIAKGPIVVLKFRQDAKLDPALLLQADPEPRRPDAAAAGGPAAGPVETRQTAPEGPRPERAGVCSRRVRRRAIPVSPDLLVDGPRDVRGRARVHAGGDSGRKTARSGGAGRSVRAGRAAARAVEPVAGRELKY